MCFQVSSRRLGVSHSKEHLRTQADTCQVPAGDNNKPAVQGLLWDRSCPVFHERTPFLLKAAHLVSAADIPGFWKKKPRIRVYKQATLCAGTWALVLTWDPGADSEEGRAAKWAWSGTRLRLHVQ
jgi:hypothetical protein